MLFSMLFIAFCRSSHFPLHELHMDSSVRHLVVDVTDMSDERDCNACYGADCLVTATFVQWPIWWVSD